MSGKIAFQVFGHIVAILGVVGHHKQNGILAHFFMLGIGLAPLPSGWGAFLEASQRTGEQTSRWAAAMTLIWALRWSLGLSLTTISTS